MYYTIVKHAASQRARPRIESPASRRGQDKRFVLNRSAINSHNSAISMP